MRCFPWLSIQAKHGNYNIKSKQVLQSPTYTVKRTSKEDNLIGMYHLAPQVVLCLTTKDMVLPESTVTSTRLHCTPGGWIAVKQVMWLSTNTNTSHNIPHTMVYSIINCYHPPQIMTRQLRKAAVTQQHTHDSRTWMRTFHFLFDNINM